MTTSAAVPGWLLRYGDQATQLDDHLARTARSASEALQAFASTWPDIGYPRHDPAADAVTHALRNREVDAWVGRIGQAFRRADMANGGWWTCRIPPEPVVVDDNVLTSAVVGFATNEQAAAAGRAFADDVARAIDDDYGDIDPTTLHSWRDTMHAHQHDAAYTAAFYNRLGATRTLRIVKAVEDHYPHDEFGDPRWGLGVIQPFSEALATAMRARTDPNVRTTFRLRQRFVDDIVVPPKTYDYREPQEHHLGLLFREGRFPTDVLLALGRNVVDVHLGSTFRASPFAINAWGPVDDPVSNVLGAIAKDAGASLTYLSGRGTLRTFLERWANDLDGDTGRDAAHVLEAALTHPRSTELYRQAVAITADLGEIRNWFNHEALASATAAHIDHVTTTASTLGDHEGLNGMHDFLATLLADSEAAAKVYDAAVRHTYDIIGQADVDDTLGSELSDIGSLFALVLTADAHADLRDAHERIARRDALLDGIEEITDIALGVTGGKWVPFAKTGRNVVIDSFRHTGELDETLDDVRALENELRLRLSIVIAVRMVQTGKLAPPPGGLPAGGLADNGEDDLKRLAAWVNTGAARDVISPLRADAGQYMDEVERLLPPLE